jgi:protein O-mannosyl-transferase
MKFIERIIDNSPISEIFKALVLICFCGVICFFATVHSPFLYDDTHVIQENPYIKNLSEFQQMVGVQNIFNRSILLLTFSVNYAIGQENVFGYHLINIMLHLCVGIMLYFLTLELVKIEQPTLISRIQKLPLAVSLIHILNPINVESITYLSSRSSVLVTLFYISTFYLFIRFVNSKKTKKKWEIILYPLSALFLFYLGLGTKEIIVTLPILAVLYLWVKSSTKNLYKYLPELAVILIPLMIYLLYRYVEMGNLLVIKNDPFSYMIDRGLYIITQVKVIISYYLVKTIFPINLNFEPDIRLVSGFLNWEWIACLIIAVGMAIAIYNQKSILLKFAFAWALITILPTSSIIPLKQIATEHRIYLPGIGISMGLGIIFLRAASINRLMQLIFVVFLVFYGLLTMKRSLEYRSEINLWEDTVKKSPYKSLAHNNLGTAYLYKNQLKEARKSFEVSSALAPSSTDPYINLGHIHSRNKEWDKAKLKYDLALKLGAQRSQVFFHSGLMRLKLKKPEEALPFLLEAIKIKNHRAIYHHELGNALRMMKEYDLSLKSYRKALKLEPNHVEAQNNIAVIFWKLKALDKAEMEFKKALAIKDKSTIHKNLANVYIAKKEFSKAITHLKTVIRRDPNDSRAKSLLHVVEIIQKLPTR